MSLSRRPTGLPSTPRARTFTAGQATPRRGQDIIPRPGSSASERPPPSSYQFQSQEPPPLPSQGRTLRPARSIGAISIRPTGSARSRSLDRRADPRHDSTYSEPPPPLPAMPSLPRGTKLAPSSQRGREIPAHSVSQSVDDTASRSRYGGEERGRAMPAHSTSQSVDHKGHRSRYRAEEAISDSASSSGASDISGRSPTSAASSRTSIDEADMEDKMEHKTPAGAGSSLWASITGVASNLTISVSKAWSSNIQTYNGEETPVGGESRLTRALKAYHIDKARDPADLPEWLFDERERGVRSYQTPSGAREKKTAQTQGIPELSRSVTTVTYHESLPPARTVRGPTLADRKNSAAFSGAGSDAHVTKSISRLRELRDAKRNAKVRFGDEMEEADEVFAPPPLPVAPPVVERVEPRLPPPTRPRGMPGTPLGASLGVRGRQPSARMGLPSGVRPVRA